MLLKNAAVALVIFLIASVQPLQAADKPSGHSRRTHIVTFKPEMSAAERRRLVQAMGATVVRELEFIDALVVAMDAVQPQVVDTLSMHPSVEGVEENSYRRWIESAFAPLAPEALPSVADMLSAARQAKLPVPSVGKPVPAPTPEGELKKGELPWGIARVKAPEAWKATMGAGVKVGVIDTGVDCTHPDLAPNCAGGINVVDPSKDPADDNGHGTHVSGTIAGAKDGKGVAGVAPKAKIYAIKVLDSDGGGTVEDIIKGINWATANGMQVINMSLGGPGHSAAMQKAVKKAYAAGITIVAAAGNDPNTPVGEPASYKESIAVSASTFDDKLAFFSTTGPEVAFIAPGHEIYSDAPGGGLAKHSGTSMATPHVAGLAALAISMGASGPKAVREALTRIAVPLKGVTGPQQGAGMPEADKLAQ